VQAHGEVLQGLPILPAVAFAAVMVCVNSALGLYRHDSAPSFIRSAPRLLVALLVGFPIAYLIFFTLPDGGVYQDALGYAVVLAVAGLLLLRRLLDAMALGAGLLTRRVLVLGTGADALAVDQSLTGQRAGYAVVGFYPILNNQEVAVPQQR